MPNFYSGIAGQRGYNPLGFILHNDAGSKYANVSFYKSWLPTHDAYNGFAHYYIADDGTYQAEKDSNIAWHAGNSYYNLNFIGIEACQSMGDNSNFLKNEETCLKLIASLCKKYNINPTRTTIILHQEASATSCPHKSYDLHGKSINQVKDYFISQIKKYMSNQNEKPQPEKITQGIPKPKAGLWYRSHLSNVGWLGFVGSEVTSGTTGKSIPIEAIDVRWDNQTDKISASFQDIKGKWHEWEYGDTGTTGKALALSVVRFDLGLDVRNTGRTLQYRVHSADIGWSDWKNQGEVAGTSGKQIEAIQMRMLKDGKVEKG